MKQSSAKGIARSWLVLGLAIQGVAAALFVSSTISSERVSSLSGGTPAPPAIVEESITGTAAGEVRADNASAPPASRREELPGAELKQRVHMATEALAQALEAPEYDPGNWQDAVRNRAEALGPEALPTLRAVLADEDRSPEEHVAANQLAAAIEQ